MLREQRTVLRLIGRNRLPAIALLLAMILFGALLEVVGVGLVFPLISLVADPSGITHSAMLSWLWRVAGFTDQRAFIAMLALAMAGMFIAKNGYMIVLIRVQTGLLGTWRQETSVRLMRLYLEAPYAFHLQKNSAELIRNLALIGAIFESFAMANFTFVVNAAMTGGIIGLLLAAQPAVTMVAGLILLSLAALQYRLIGRIFVRLGKSAPELARQRQKLLQQALGAIKEARVLGCEPYFLAQFAAIERWSVRNMRRAQFYGNLSPQIMEMALIVGIMTIITVVLVSSGTPSQALSGLGLLGAAAFRLSPLFNRILLALTTMANSSHAVGLVAAEFAALEGTRRAEAPAPERLEFRQEIRFETVSCHYPGSASPALSGLDLTIRRGEFLGLIGASGAGKTTLVDLLLGLLEPSAGRILIDGRDLQTTLRAWRRNLGYVPQTIYLCDDTLRRNVAFGLEDGAIDDDRIRQALRLADLTDFVDSLPAGLDTVLGERGSRLSGGQRQRIGIARALYHDPEVLILDEATASLDVGSESRIADAIAKFRGLKTVIVIAHRLSTLHCCDRLIFLNQGRMAASGSFAELARGHAEFQEMLSLSKVLAAE